jgi:hypothetical protein
MIPTATVQAIIVSPASAQDSAYGSIVEDGKSGRSVISQRSRIQVIQIKLHLSAQTTTSIGGRTHGFRGGDVHAGTSWCKKAVFVSNECEFSVSYSVTKNNQ